MTIKAGTYIIDTITNDHELAAIPVSVPSIDSYVIEAWTADRKSVAVALKPLRAIDTYGIQADTADFRRIGLGPDVPTVEPPECAGGFNKCTWPATCTMTLAGCNGNKFPGGVNIQEWNTYVVPANVNRAYALECVSVQGYADVCAVSYDMLATSYPLGSPFRGYLWPVIPDPNWPAHSIPGITLTAILDVVVYEPTPLTYKRRWRVRVTLHYPEYGTSQTGPYIGLWTNLCREVYYSAGFTDCTSPVGASYTRAANERYPIRFLDPPTNSVPDPNYNTWANGSTITIS